MLTSRGAPALGEHIDCAEVYSSSGAFTPRFSDNLRAASWVLFRSQAELWHFVFAPNARTSGVARWLKRLRRRRVVQTVASSPRSFAGVGELLFGDVVVAQSQWTRRQIEQACAEQGLTVPRLEVVPPPVPDLAQRDPSRIARLLSELAIDPAQPLFVYPGDLETSRGAETVAAIAERLETELPQATVVFAYRNKTERAPLVAAQLKSRLDGKRVRFVPEIEDVLLLIAAASAVVFPVDDLWGKVDLPIVLLESMALGVPVLALDQGPLADLQGVLKLSSLDVRLWVERCVALGRDGDARGRAAEEGRAAVQERYHAKRVARAYEDLYLTLVKS